MQIQDCGLDRLVRRTVVVALLHRGLDPVLDGVLALQLAAQHGRFRFHIVRRHPVLAGNLHRAIGKAGGCDDRHVNLLLGVLHCGGRFLSGAAAAGVVVMGQAD